MTMQTKTNEAYAAIDARILALKRSMHQNTAARYRIAPFYYKPFSVKQKKVLTWWMPESPVREMDGLIADGSIRSGKTLSMSLSFGLWAMSFFENQNLLLCGKTIGSLRRNVVFDWKRQMKAHGYAVREKRTDNLLIVTKGGVTNLFYLFGGRDERSQDLVQGITAAGVLFDEVALMPRSFVDQAISRCSVAGSKYWFNCNPDHPYHWFKTEWIDKLLCQNRHQPATTDADGKPLYKNLLYLHFTMDDNLSLSEKIKARYRAMFSGVFYRRFVSGQWCAADGLIYDMFDPELHTYAGDAAVSGTRYILVDYGTSNPTCFLDVYDDKKTVRIVNEYYYDSRKTGRQKTNREYAEDFAAFVGDGVQPLFVVVDPSAASFKVELRNRGFRVKDAKNDVVDGIEKVAAMFNLRALLIRRDTCSNLINELSVYSWDRKASDRGREQPVKQNDHACDALRYGVSTVIYSPRRFSR